jgi:hypothetical protein
VYETVSTNIFQIATSGNCFFRSSIDTPITSAPRPTKAHLFKNIAFHSLDRFLVLFSKILRLPVSHIMLVCNISAVMLCSYGIPASESSLLVGFESYCRNETLWCIINIRMPSLALVAVLIYFLVYFLVQLHLCFHRMMLHSYVEYMWTD